MNLTETILAAAANHEILTIRYAGTEADLLAELAKSYTDVAAARRLLAPRFVD
ncbi:hypothetical protein LCGC14_0728000 [marine sediment metagenome]|uniref:Uncharacterized protein n=1 Tax=marine sediment metagenome TaxID=412755 RepID=A0A0F9THM5_9ZZZZ